MSLKALGWPNSWPSETENAHGLARISAVLRGQYKALGVMGELVLTLPGKFLQKVENSGEYPAIGDWVRIAPVFKDAHGKNQANIESLIPRFSKISRIKAGTESEEQVLAANVEFAFIVTSTNHDLNLNRLRRYVMIAQGGSVEPIIILSKIDLDPNYKTIEHKIKNEFRGIRVFCISSLNNIGVNELLPFLISGSTSVVLGSSGVGKSTLVNYFLGSEIQEVRQIRDDDDKGMHTTTSRELFVLENGGLIIDTPGLREIQVFGAQELLDSGFTHISDLKGKCKFSDCTHVAEPGCAILGALESGELSNTEWEQFNKLSRELEFAERKMDKQAHSNAKKRWKAITMDVKKRRKFSKR